jgi:CHAT domain-containing protein/Tfp pilus assembly protein PilF
LTAGEQHEYRITLAAGEYARVEVEQRGADIAVALLADKGAVIEDRMLPSRNFRVTLSILAQTSADYRIGTRIVSKLLNAGQYEIKLVERRPAAEGDQNAVAAERAATEGWRLFLKGDAESTLRAREKFETARAAWQKLGDRYGQGVALLGLGQSWQPQYKFQNALECYGQAITHFRAVEARRETAALRNLVGRALVAVGDIQRGIENFLDARQFWLATNDQEGSADALYSLGLAYGRLHDYQKSLAYYEQALPIHHALSNRRAEAQTLNNIGTIYAQEKNFQKSISYFQQAQEIWEALGNTLSVTNALTNLGAAYDGLNEYAKALEYYERALEGWRKVKNQMGEAATLNNIGGSLYKMGKGAEARERASQALELALAIGDRRVQTEARATIAGVERDQGNYQASRKQIEQILADVEAERATIVSEGSRASLFANYREHYDFYLDLLMRQREPGYEAAALEVSEGLRARSLLDLLKESGADLRQSIDPALAARELDLRRKIEAASDSFRKADGGRLTAEQKERRRRELTLLTADYDQVQAEIRARRPQYAELTWPRPLSLSEIQRRALDKDTLLLEYALGDENSYLFAVTQTSISAFPLPAREKIEEAVKRYYEQVTALGAQKIFRSVEEKRAWMDRVNKESQTSAEALSRMLLDPARGLLGSKRLLFVGDGALRLVPFAALPEPAPGAGRRGIKATLRTETKGSAGQEASRPGASPPLIVNHEILSLPSASTLAALRAEMSGRKPAPKTLALFADPVFELGDERVKAVLAQSAPRAEASTASRNEPRNGQGPLRDAMEDFSEKSGAASLPRLPSTRQEALAIQALAPESERLVKLDFDASREAVDGADLQSYRYIHFATHGLLNNSHPELSGLILSLVNRQGREQNGFLRTMDVSGLRLAADLVVLSGCRTGLGKEVSGEGMLGLTRAFLYAGAERVVASLWQVNDNATAELMKRFYQEMLGEQRQPPAAALRAAQTAMWKSKQWSNPYYWAAFTLQGEW